MRHSKKDIAFIEIKKHVLTVDRSPGSALDEVALSELYGLSRTPMREVFHRPAGEGYVTLEGNRGATVSSMDLATMRGFFQTAPMIYAAVARLATQHASNAQINALKKIQHSLSKAVQNSLRSIWPCRIIVFTNIWGPWPPHLI